MDEAHHPLEQPSLFPELEPPAGPTPAPFLKWAGGKRQLLPVLLAGAPADFGRYLEPFLGGGALLFALHEHEGRCIASDINPELIMTYRAVRDDCTAVLDELKVLAAGVSEADYYEVRSQHPSAPASVAARMIYLNRTCFNGIYRQNRSGEFNVPWGGERSSDSVYRPEPIQAASRRLAAVDLSVCDFTETISQAGSGDWVYVDPPYIPLSATASFATYAKDGFGIADQERLAESLAAAIGRGAFVMLSNSNAPLTAEIFGPPGLGLELFAVSARRALGAKSTTRTTVREVLGVGYPVSAMAHPTAFSALTLPPEQP